ncbi:MAG: right-handed parallel beta-helix repeat-containing protein [Candidatus Coatesbacteria bacterium]|nr:right-handed parallel beta-helix repeat-containing protein [Candidatus Coatesbacteria bacterium]
MIIKRELIFAVALVTTMLLISVVGAFAADDDGVLHVPAEYSTIQNAIGTAQTGEVILVSAGTYDASTETFPITITQGGITLRGAGMGLTIIDASSANPRKRVIKMSGVDHVTLVGLTITGGHVVGSGYSDYAGSNGGGIYAYDCEDLLIQDCEITNNYAKGSFASRDGEGNFDWYGQYGSDGSKASARAGGGGLYLRYCKDTTGSATVTIDRCVIHDNKTGMGGGGVCSNYAPAIITDCCIYGNKACQGAGVYWFDYVVNGAKIEHILFNDLIILNEICLPAYWGKYEKLAGSEWTAGEGAGLYMSNWGLGQKFRIYNATIADNDGYHGYCSETQKNYDHGGYEVYISHSCSNADLKGANNIFWPNENDDKGYYDNGYDGKSDMSYSDIYWKNSCGNEQIYPGKTAYAPNYNILEVPQFDYYGEYSVICQRYFLQRSSDAVDTGTSGPRAYTPEVICGSTNNAYTTDVRGYYDGSNKPSTEYEGGGDLMDMGFHHRTDSCSYIELTSFEAKASPDGVVLNWETGVELDNAGFAIYRTVSGEGNYRCISGLIPAEGSASSGASYAFVDEDVNMGVSYEYWLVDIETTGKWTAHGPVSARMPMLLTPIMSEFINR